MPERNFRELIDAKWAEEKLVCIGLDSDLDKIPEMLRKSEDFGMRRFNFEIVEATRDLVCAYKPNIAFYESAGVVGMIALSATVDFIREKAPGVPIIGDMKRGDTDNTSIAYAKAAFDYFGFDAITISGYLGKEASKPFLDRKNKGVFVLCRTSNQGADDPQDLDVVVSDRKVPLYLHIAYMVANFWNDNKNCGLVVGAAHPDKLAYVRAAVGDEMPILVPGVGAQDGDLQRTLEAGKKNMIINVSRSIIFASSGPDFAQAARRETLKLNKGVQLCRQQ